MSPGAARPRVAVSGLGAVTAWGWGVEPLRDGLASGTSAIGPFTRFEHRPFRTHLAAEVPPPPPPVVGALEAAVAGWARLSWAERFAVAAALEAWRDAGPWTEPPGRVGVYFASTAAGTFEGEGWLAGRRPLRALVGQDYCGPGDAVARALGARGPVITLSTACSSATLALGLALEALRDGEVDVAVAGGADALCRLTYAGFNALRAVDEAPCRPFRADRAGMSIGEGAAVLVLERERDAGARGARLHAFLLGAGASCDAHHMTAPATDGAGPAAAIVAALADAGLGPEAVDFVNSHGTGTPQNDVAELAALRLALGERVASLPLTSTKGSIGHLLGAAGAVEAVAAVLGVEHGEVHPTPGEGPVDPALAVDLVHGSPRRDPGLRVAISDSLAFGGANGALVVARESRAEESSAIPGSEAPVVTGVGAASPAGLGWPALAAALGDGGRPTLRVDRAALRAALEPATARRAGAFSQLALVAAAEAITAAGLAAPLVDAGVAVATTHGAATVTEELVRTILERGPGAASPFLFPESLASAAAAQIAISWRAGGPSLTVTQRAAGPLQAAALAAGLIRKGRATRMLVGAVDEVSPLLEEVLTGFRALASSTARPFDRRRDGFVLGEGGLAWVVESPAAALARGARPLARILGGVSAFDPTASPWSWGRDGEGLAGELAAGLARLGVDRGEVDLIVSGANGARAGDALEAAVLARVWAGRPLPPVVAPKAVTGEVGAAGLAAALVALAGGALAPARGFEVDPGLGVGPLATPLGAPPRRVLVSALAAGGAAAWLLLGSTER